MRRFLGPINRFAASMLAVIWAAAAIAGIALGLLLESWLVLLTAPLTLWYSFLWLRVALAVHAPQPSAWQPAHPES